MRPQWRICTGCRLARDDRGHQRFSLLLKRVESADTASVRDGGRLARLLFAGTGPKSVRCASLQLDQFLRLLIPTYAWGFIVKYKVEKSKMSYLMRLVWFECWSRQILRWGGSSSVSRQGSKWGAVVSSCWNVSWYILLISSAFQGSFLITDPGMCRNSSWSQ